MADEPLGSELLQRLRERAGDPQRRSDSDSLASHTTDLGSILGQLGSGAGPLQGMLGQLAGAMKGIGVMAPMAGAEGRRPQPLPPPATAEQFAIAQQMLGRPVPASLRQLYEIADGGFGPGSGLFPLDRALDEYDRLVAEPAGPQNQPWPANLLPLTDAEPGHDCLNLDTGEITSWDPEEIDGYGNAAWERSFKPAAKSLAEWLQAWLDRPSAGDRVTEQQARWKEEGRRMAAQGMVAFYAKKTPEERAAMGLPEVGWEDELLKRNGFL